ncbi:hypothetical protein CsSME_00041607 [Camellia sinensis var. sinensis]
MVTSNGYQDEKPGYLEEEPEFEEEWDFEASPTMFVVTQADSDEEIDFDEGVHEQCNAITKEVDANSITDKSILVIESQFSTFKDLEAHLVEKLGEQTEEEIVEKVIKLQHPISTRQCQPNPRFIDATFAKIDDTKEPITFQETTKFNNWRKTAKEDIDASIHIQT